MKRKKQREGAGCLGYYVPVPIEFMRSRACAELSPLATKLLIDILAQLGPTGRNNGDVSLAPKVLRTRGWTSRTSINSACIELEDAGLIVKTRQGGRLNRPGFCGGSKS